MGEMEINLKCMKSQTKKEKNTTFLYCTLQMSIKAVFIKPVEYTKTCHGCT